MTEAERNVIEVTSRRYDIGNYSSTHVRCAGCNNTTAVDAYI